MRIGEFLGCHQMAERSFSCRGYQFPVCARCTGVIISALVALPLFFFYKLNLVMACFMSLVMLLDWLVQYLKIKESTNMRRLITGLIGGFGWTYIHLYFYQFTFNAVVTIMA